MIRVLAAAAEKFGWAAEEGVGGRRLRRGLRHGCRRLRGLHGRGRGPRRQSPGQPRGLRPGHGAGHQSRGGQDPIGRRHHDGPGLRTGRGGPFQGRRGPGPQLPVLQNPALLLAADGSRRCSSTPRTRRRRGRRAGHHRHPARWSPTRSSTPPASGTWSFRSNYGPSPGLGGRRRSCPRLIRRHVRAPDLRDWSFRSNWPHALRSREKQAGCASAQRGPGVVMLRLTYGSVGLSRHDPRFAPKIANLPARSWTSVFSPLTGN